MGRNKEIVEVLWLLLSNPRGACPAVTAEVLQRCEMLVLSLSIFLIYFLGFFFYGWKITCF